MFKNRKHKINSNIKRSNTLKKMYEMGQKNPNMGQKRLYDTPEKLKRAKINSHFKHKYGITVEQYDLMVKEQNGLCAICQKLEKLFVDHCHITGKIRGLLCLKCNLMLGSAVDNLDILNNGISYLKKQNE
jgi:hypothetical protein